ncbi:MAG: hypothetical protein AAF391_00475 [Bacteroidota bacterium]
MILLLLLEPSIKKINSTINRPIIAIAVDNSESVTARGADSVIIKSKINQLKSELSNQDIEIEIFNLNQSDSINFNQRTTRLSGMLRDVDNKMEEKNFVATVLLTDGIYNRGSSPLYRNYITPIFAVGMGDSIPPKDISLSRVQYNRITFKGNESPIRLEISQEGYRNRNIAVRLSENGRDVETKNVQLNSEIQEIEFLVNSEEEGLRHLVATIPTDPDEAIKENNRLDIFLEVIDGRQKVLIVANAPHPDIKAIRSTLAATDNYTTEVFIPSLSPKRPTDIYDVVIYHGAFSSPLTYEPKEKPGIWYILNDRSALNRVNSELPFINIQRRGGQPDKVSGSFNQNFSKFKIDNTEVFEEYPPIEVPFGEYEVSGPTEILMFQKLGSVTTRKPLMVVFDDGGQKSAALMGQNIWQWKLQEAAIHDEATNFQNFITKTIQFLSVKNDKKQFRFKARSSTFEESSAPLFDSEVYNDIYERIYNNTIQVTITDESGTRQNFDFTDSELNATFKAPTLDPGVYSYSAQVKVGDKTFRDGGEFLIENVNPEYLNLTANHRLLRNLADKTGGQFVTFDEIDRLPQLISSQDFKASITSEEDYEELLKSWWYFLLIFLLFSTEWVLRRYWGGY